MFCVKGFRVIFSDFNNRNGLLILCCSLQISWTFQRQNRSEFLPNYVFDNPLNLVQQSFTFLFQSKINLNCGQKVLSLRSTFSITSKFNNTPFDVIILKNKGIFFGLCLLRLTDVKLDLVVLSVLTAKRKERCVAVFGYWHLVLCEFETSDAV